MTNPLRLAAAATAALLLTTALAACGSEAGSDGTPDSGGPWSYTDGSGETGELESTPTRITRSRSRRSPERSAARR